MDEQVTPPVAIDTPVEAIAAPAIDTPVEATVVAEIEAEAVAVEAEAVSLFDRATEMAHNIVHHSFGRASEAEPVVKTIINGSN